MPGVPDTTYRKMAGAGAVLAAVVVFCVLYLDVPLAYFVRDYLYANPRWSKTTADLPDLLLGVVVLATIGSFVLYLFRARTGVLDRAAFWAREVIWLAPASYLAKMLLKIAFGRSNTRWWLEDPDLYGFHWFAMKEHCDGFPSGHMMVIVALLASLWRFYPKTRPAGVFTAVLLGVALVATNYHFVSDVIAGGYLGILLEMVVSGLALGKKRPGVASF